MIEQFLLELIQTARASEFPEHGEYWIWLAFVIGNVLMFVPSFGWTHVKETDEEWSARILKQRKEQSWWSLS